MQKQNFDVLIISERHDKYDGTSSKQDLEIKENVDWLVNISNQEFSWPQLRTYIKMGPPILNIADDAPFIDQKLLDDILSGKELFNNVPDHNALKKARARANPFETIRNGFFLNRAALKMANIDATTEYMFTNVDTDKQHKTKTEPYYFADVCGGPGGFTEYILWRKRNWSYKGFGFTLTGEHDFQLSESKCIVPTTFRTYYGCDNTGNIYSIENIEDFRDKIFHHTNNLGVHFMMSDGGFSVRGEENLQEVRSKQIYLCQCLMALEIVRPDGHFVTKLFDLFTNFSVGLIYLMYLCFEKVAIFKPLTSRPANAERFFIAKGLKNKPQTHEIKKYLRHIAGELRNSGDMNEAKTQTTLTIREIVPEEILKKDIKFCDYIRRSNQSIGERQKVALANLKTFFNKPTLQEERQDELRNACLKLWNIPKKPRKLNMSITELLNKAVSRQDFMLEQPKAIKDIYTFKNIVTNVKDWQFVPLLSPVYQTYANKPITFTYCHFFAAVYEKNKCVVKKLRSDGWTNVKNLQLSVGTLLYGELVKEKCTNVGEDNSIESIRSNKLSLHIVDALTLGEVSLAEFSFEERQVSIQTFCKAVNFEGLKQSSTVRVRPIVLPLQEILSDTLIQFNPETKQYESSLNVLGYKHSTESQDVHSIMLINPNYNSFQSIYIHSLLVNVCNSSPEINLEPFVPCEDIRKYVNSVINT